VNLPPLFSMDEIFESKEKTIDLAKAIAEKYPHTTQYVVKYPNQRNYNITMNIGRIKLHGAEIIWCSREMN
jgi:hypothetical protein